MRRHDRDWRRRRGGDRHRDDRHGGGDEHDHRDDHHGRRFGHHPHDHHPDHPHPLDPGHEHFPGHPFHERPDPRALFAWHHPQLFAHLQEHRRRWREGLRLYYGAHLHRRLFFLFGAAIFATAGIVGLFMRLTGTMWGEKPPRAWMLFALPALTLWILSGKMARRIARPLYELVMVSKEIGRGNLAARAQSACRGIDEIAILGRSMNDMAARIERQLAEGRELLAGVSHELRTPLARLRVLTDIARDQGALGKTMTDIDRELEEMDKLVGELLASARLDFQALSPKPLEGVDVAARALERAGLPAERLQAKANPVPFAGDPTLVGRALANLIDNANKHGKGLEGLTVSARPGFVVFEVDDRGPGFDPALKEQLFQPFVRSAGEGSLGLGLSLVARIARAHRGSVDVATREGGGARMTLALAVDPLQGAEARTGQSPAL